MFVSRSVKLVALRTATFSSAHLSALVMLASAALTLGAEQASAEPIVVRGTSGQRLYSALANRSEDVKRSSKESGILKRPIDVLSYRDLIKCEHWHKKGWFGPEKYNCELVATNHYDLRSNQARVIGKADPEDVVADFIQTAVDVNNAAFLGANAKFGGTSAQYWFSQLQNLFERDKQVTWVERPLTVRGAQIGSQILYSSDVVSCSKWTIGERSGTTCLIAYATATDTNSPAERIDQSADKR